MYLLFIFSLTFPKLLRYLLELDCESDPAWDCISNMHRWLLRLLLSSKGEFQLGHVRTACELMPLPPGLMNYEEPPPAVPPRIRGTSVAEHGHNRTMSDVSYASSTSSQSTGECSKLQVIVCTVPHLTMPTAHPVPAMRILDRADAARPTISASMCSKSKE